MFSDFKINDYELKADFKAFNTEITVVFIETEDLNECQKENYEGFISKQDLLLTPILEKVFEFYQSSYANYRIGWTAPPYYDGNETELEKYLPKPTTPENLKPFITPIALYIEKPDECTPGTFNISFKCTWDIEHGLGVFIKNWLVEKADSGLEVR